MSLSGRSCEVIRDRYTGESLRYAFVEFETKEQCEAAYAKMDNVLIDDRRIHVDFSQSVAKAKLQMYRQQRARSGAGRNGGGGGGGGSGMSSGGLPYSFPAVLASPLRSGGHGMAGRGGRPQQQAQQQNRWPPSGIVLKDNLNWGTRGFELIPEPSAATVQPPPQPKPPPPSSASRPSRFSSAPPLPSPPPQPTLPSRGFSGAISSGGGEAKRSRVERSRHSHSHSRSRSKHAERSSERSSSSESHISANDGGEKDHRTHRHRHHHHRHHR